MCTGNHNHIRCSSWDTEWDIIFCHFGPCFAVTLPFTPPLTFNNLEIKILEKWKKAYRDVILQSWCMLPEIWSVTDIIFCHARPVFALLPHYWPQQSKFKKSKKPGDIILLHVFHKWRSYDAKFLRYGANILDYFLPLACSRGVFSTLSSS